MKKILVLIIILFNSCIKHDVGKIDLNHLSSLAVYNVNPSKDEVVILTNDRGDTTCISNVSMLITRNKDMVYKETRVDLKDFGDYANKGVYDESSILCFEDTKDGDYDYNDLVVKVSAKIIKSGKKYQVKLRITPIALGSTKTIALFFETFGGNHYMIASDCRRDLFKGDRGFINTSHDYRFNGYKEINFPVIEIGGSDDINHLRLNWYINVDGKRLYVASYVHDREYFDYIGVKGLPHALSISDLNFRYPIETISITKAYPRFIDWVYGKEGFIKENIEDYLY